jgi:hypothetical protein
MPIPRYWRVVVKGGHKAHLTLFVPEQGSGEIALCGQTLPEDARTRGASITISDPHGNECRSCLIASGHLKRPPRRKPTEEQQKAIAFYRNIAQTPDLLLRMGMSPSDAASMLQNLLGLAPK